MSSLPDEIDQLISDLTEGSIDSDGMSRLEEILAADADARQHYYRLMSTHTALSWRFGSGSQDISEPDLDTSFLLEVVEEQASLADKGRHTEPGWITAEFSGTAEALAELARLHEEGLKQSIELERHRKQRATHDHVCQTHVRRFSAKVIASGSIAAAIALAGLTVLMINLFTGPERQTAEQLDDAIVVATLTDATDAAWETEAGDEIDLPINTLLTQGQYLKLTEGFAEITTHRGAIAILQGPATIELIDSPNAIRLHTGKMVGICETESSKGFLVRTRHMDITDLGTRFGVDVSHDDSTEVHVLSGQVKVMSQDATADSAATLLEAGQSARMEKDSDAIVSINNDAETYIAITSHAIKLPSTGQGLATNQADPNWQVVAIDGQPLDSSQALSVNRNHFYTQWIQNDPATAQWISWDPGQEPAVGSAFVYTFRTQLHIPQSLDLGTTTITLRYAADNKLRSIRINGQLQSIDTAQPVSGMKGVYTLVMGDQFKAGNNVVELDIANIRSRQSVAGQVGLWAHWELNTR